jgi:hypothetical protein
MSLAPRTFCHSAKKCAIPLNNSNPKPISTTGIVTMAIRVIINSITTVVSQPNQVYFA